MGKSITRVFIPKEKDGYSDTNQAALILFMEEYNNIDTVVCEDGLILSGSNTIPNSISPDKTEITYTKYTENIVLINGYLFRGYIKTIKE